MDKNRKRMETMHRLRTKGLELFYQKGYHTTSIDDILRELSLSKGAFYHHFKSKEDFFISIVQNIVAKKVYALLIDPLTHDKSPIPAILDSIENAIETAEHNQMDCGFVLANFLNEFNKTDNHVIPYLRDILRIWEVNLISLLKKGRSDGHINWSVNCDEAATYIIASYMGIRTMMVGANSKLVKYQYLQQLKAYLHSMEKKNETIAY
jgi:AcrR family transcriptional regulator